MADAPLHRRSLQTDRIPLEIWLQIIAHSGISQSEIQSLSLTSRFLAWATQPLLFHTFTATPSRISDKEPGGIRGQDAKYVEHLDERLQFATSVRIAHGVRSVVIATAEDPGSPSPDEDLVSADTIVDKVFDALGRFPSLKALHVAGIDFTAQRINQLASLPTLQGVHIGTRTTIGQLDLTGLPIRQLSLHVAKHDTSGWRLSQLLSPTLEHFSCETMEAECDLVLAALAVGTRMRSLRSLYLPGRCYDLPNFASALRQCPNIEELYIPEPTFHDPRLRQLVPPIPLQLRKLRSISIPLARIMKGVQDVPIKHISVNVWHMLERPSISALFQEFPTRFAKLEEFVIRACNTALSSVFKFIQPFQRLEGLYVEITEPLQPCTRMVSAVTPRVHDPT